MKKPIYLDHHATTPLDSRIFDEMEPFFREKFGNPSSIDHSYGNEALEAVNIARNQVAALINADVDEIIFTSGATESDNLAIMGVAQQYNDKGNRIITCVTEHKAVLDTCHRLEKLGYKVSYLKVNSSGAIDLDELEGQITPQTILISVMAANNEIGVVAPLAKIGKIARLHNIFFHSDAAQAFGHIPLDVNEMKIDLMSISGHKIYGPKGIGVLYVRRKDPQVKLTPLFYGGGHEKGMRSGTLNTPGIVGLGKAAAIAKQEMDEESKRLKTLAERLYKGINSKVKVEINGDAKHKLSHNLNLYFEGIDAKALINEVKDYVAISAGSACTTNDVKPSHVIFALGYGEDRAYSSVRFGLGRFTTEEEIEKTIDVVTKAALKIKNL